MLEEQIKKLTSQTVPMHMPGHKRHLMPVRGLPYDLDITEIAGADDLHDAGGILAQAMEKTAQLYGSRRTWYLVGGSTCGILAGIRAAITRGSEIIAARNCHRSVYHAIELGDYRVHWVYPAQETDFGICLDIRAEDIARAIRRSPGARGVVITSPTYEGILSDVRAISKVCHKAGIPLIVDEAHGAHLGLFEEGGFGEGALLQGADLVVQSAHKTLPSLTQTAWMHIGGDLIDELEVERQLGIFETSSPSYPLMASLDGCTRLLQEQGPELFAAWGERLDCFAEKTKGLQLIRIFGRNDPGRRDGETVGQNVSGRHDGETVGQNVSGRLDNEIAGQNAPGRHDSEIVGQNVLSRHDNESPVTKRQGDSEGLPGVDRSKILISFRRTGLIGAQAAGILREKYGIEPEMSSGYCVLAMTGCGDTEESIDMLAEALCDMERKVRTGELCEMDGKALTDELQESAGNEAVYSSSWKMAGSRVCSVTLPHPRAVCTAFEAVEQEWEEVKLEECEGRISAEYLYVYPPGIPFLAPGECMEADLIRWIAERTQLGERVRHTRSCADDCIACLCE